MNPPRRRFSQILTTGTALVLLAACGSGGGDDSSDGRADDSPVKIGFIAPLSGPTGANGQRMLDAAKVAVDEINEAGGVLGRQIELLSEDDESTPAVGVTAAQNLAREDVEMVFGGWNSPVTLAEQPVLAREEILQISSITQATKILTGGVDPNAIMLNAGSPVGGYVVAHTITDTLDLAKGSVGFFTQNDDYGTDALKQITSSLESLSPDAKIVADERFPFVETQFRVQVSAMQSANPDVVVPINASQGSGLPALLEQYKAAGGGAEVVVPVGSVAPSVVELAGQGALGIYSADFYLPGVTDDELSGPGRDFLDAYKKKFGTAPERYDALAAASVQVWAQAVERAGSFEQKAVADEIKGGSFESTIFGDVKFTKNGHLISKYFIYRVNGPTYSDFEVVDEVTPPEDVQSFE